MSVYQAPVTYQFDGIYLPSEVSSYLLVSVPSELRPPTGRRILSWIRNGLMAPERRSTPGRDLLMNFEDLVTCQAITLLLQAGFSIRAIRRAEALFAEIFKTPKPFAYHEVWYSLPDIFGRADGQLISGTKGGQYALGFVGKWATPLRARLAFSKSTGIAECWRPRLGIALKPDIQFGQPCVDGTRIPTGSIWSYVKGGDTIPYVADSFGLEVADVKRAFYWEERRRTGLQATVKVPA